MQSSKYHTNKNAITLSNQNPDKKKPISTFNHFTKSDLQGSSPSNIKTALTGKVMRKILIDQQGDIIS